MNPYFEKEEDQKTLIYNNADYHRFFLEARKLDFRVVQRQDGRPMIKTDKWAVWSMLNYFSIPVHYFRGKNKTDFFIYPKKS